MSCVGLLVQLSCIHGYLTWKQNILVRTVKEMVMPPNPYNMSVRRPSNSMD